MIADFKDKNYKSKKNIYKTYRTLASNLKSVDAEAIIRLTTTSVTFSITGVGLIVVPIFAGVA